MTHTFRHPFGSASSSRFPSERARRLSRLVPAAAAFLPAACGQSARAASAPASSAVVVASDDVATVQERSVLSGPMISGALAPQVQAIVRAQVGGAVSATLAERGTPVAAGAVLARIDDHTQRAAQASALAELRTAEGAAAVARRRAERTDRLLAAGAVSAEQAEDDRQGVAAAEAERAAAHSRLAAATQELTHATVRSPMGGVVSARSVGAGDVVQPGAPMFEVLDPSSMRLEASVPSAQLAALHVGAAVQFTVTGYAGRVFTGRIERVSPAVDAATRQVPVLVTIDNRDGRLVAGLYAEGRIAAEERRAVLAPTAAVDASSGRPAVLRLSGDRVARVEVETGARYADQGEVEIVSGLVPGDTVLVGTAHGRLAPGAAVRVAASTITVR